MPKPDIEKIKSLMDSIIPGPWVAKKWGGDIAIYQGPTLFTRGSASYKGKICVMDDQYASEDYTKKQVSATAEFIAAARQDIPALLDYITELEAERDTAVADRDEAVEDLTNQESCCTCVHEETCEGNNSLGCCRGNWQWRGLRKEPIE